ncbi:MAG: hypothetical protein AAF849_22710 [Bacteroidota bacterium]
MAYDGPYFHARPFFEAEIERIEAENFVFQKEVQLNENVEGKTLDSLDIARELSIFIKNDINRPAYDGRYEMDSIFDPQKQLRAIKYTALDDKLPVKNLSLQFEKWGISRIELKTSSSSRLLEANSTAIYEPQTGYQIENYQKITFLGEQNMKISVDYIDRDGRR